MTGSGTSTERSWSRSILRQTISACFPLPSAWPRVQAVALSASRQLWQPGHVEFMSSTLVTAMASSAAAGKNPWLPLALVLLIAQADQVPDWLMEPQLHRGLHSLGPPSVMLGLGLLFLVLSLADSFADKVGWIEAWLTPISTTWRPFAAIAISALIGMGSVHATAHPAQLASGVGSHVGMSDVVASGGQTSPYLWLALCIGCGTFVGLIATVGKTGTRLLLTLVPIPGVRLAHSFLDDLFAWGVLLAGLVLSDSLIMLILGAIYLGVGCVTAPILGRLSLIQLRIFISAWKKFRNQSGPSKAPRWLERALPDRDLSQLLPAYAYRTRNTGLCRGGFLIVDAQGVVFAARSWFGAKFLKIERERLCRLGLAETLTSRAVCVARTLDSGDVEEATIYLFPGAPSTTSERLMAATRAAALVRVRPGSSSARLPHERQSSTRFVPASAAGNLRTQALLTLSAAIGCGLLTGGVVVPIGAGYLASPFKGRFVIGLALTTYLASSVVGTLGFAWPIALLYSVMLNAITLRDLSRHALRAHLDDVVDTYAFLPSVPSAVWVTSAPAVERFREGEVDPVTDGSWRVVWRLLSSQPAAA